MQVLYHFMLNLGVADMVTGVYLALLAIEDNQTADEYYRYAVGWQTGWGCATAGFFAVFASQLDYLYVLHCFRNGVQYQESNPRSPTWLRLRNTDACSRLCLSSCYGALPLFGISSYSTSSICLPLRVDTLWDKIYILFGLLFNMIAFSGMVVCYVFIFWMLKIEDPDAPSRPEDRAVIKKMALLIGTDMICWFPTLFFGFTAALGFLLISISDAKIFLVFFFPINSFMNPFLYVFFTKVIQRHVKKKAVPAIQRIVSMPVLSTISQYYTHPPNSRRKTHEEDALTSTMNQKCVSEHSGSENTNSTSRPQTSPEPAGEEQRPSFSLSFRRPFLHRRREGSTRSGQDSGRGSMTSESTLGLLNQERLSLATSHEGESDDERIAVPMVVLHNSPSTTADPERSGEPAKKSHNPFKMPSLLDRRTQLKEDRRRSVPIIPPLLVVSECSENSTSS
ncbi:unnamed protein product, partial [Mesorhabditis spiculigera]